MRHVFLILLFLSVPFKAAIADDFEYKIYFGLSQKDGAVSLAEWEIFEAEFAKKFTGFNVASTVGYYKGSKERSRLITLIMDACREPKLEAAVQLYVKRFKQDSVLVVKTKLENWKAVTATSVMKLDDKCEA